MCIITDPVGKLRQNQTEPQVGSNGDGLTLAAWKYTYQRI